MLPRHAAQIVLGQRRRPNLPAAAGLDFALELQRREVVALCHQEDAADRASLAHLDGVDEREGGIREGHHRLHRAAAVEEAEHRRLLHDHRAVERIADGRGKVALEALARGAARLWAARRVPRVRAKLARVAVLYGTRGRAQGLSSTSLARDRKSSEQIADSPDVIQTW